jgi:hypothetical protein
VMSNLMENSFVSLLLISNSCVFLMLYPNIAWGTFLYFFIPTGLQLMPNSNYMFLQSCVPKGA